MPSSAPRPALAANPRGGTTDPSPEAIQARPDSLLAHRLHARLLKHPVRRERAREPKEKPARVGRGGRLKQLDGLAVRRVSVGSGPGLLSCLERAWISQPLRSDQALQSGQPVFVVARTVVGFATSGSGLEFIRQRGGPLFPGVMPLLRKRDRQREGLRLPWLSEDRSSFVTRQTRQIG